jgi:membrane-bound lytic murein transglycosylase D
VDFAIDLRLVADVTDARLEEVLALNPSLLRMRTPDAMPFDLHLPVGTKDVFLERMKSIPEEKRTSWRFHTVKPGESLGAIATSFHAKLADIAETNDIGVTDTVSPGDELVIPVATAAANGSHPQFYTTKRGDTLVTVADRFNVSVENLRAWNHLKASTVSLGRRLQVSEPARLAPSLRVRGRSRRGLHGVQASTVVASRTLPAASHESKGNASKGSAGSRNSKGDSRSSRASSPARGGHVEKSSLHSSSAASKKNKQKAAR